MVRQFAGSFLTATLPVWRSVAACLLALALPASLMGAPLDQPQPADSADLTAQVSLHLAAGEFGSALELAQQADPAAQPALLQQISQSQLQAGETDPAIRTLRRISDAQTRANAGRDALNLSGGGVQADFGPLMQIILQNTSGPWLETDTEGGTMTEFATGVKVDPAGLLSRVATREASSSLVAQASQARAAALNQDLAQVSPLRMVSLTRLEKALSARLAEGYSVPETMARFAGLTRIEYVFVYPADGEVVIAGPASGWKYNAQGQAVSSSTGEPTLQLDDLVTIVRAFQRGEDHFGCSINTREAGVKALQEYAATSQARGPLSAGGVKNWASALQKKLGRQDVVVWGVPASSRVARVLVEADYRMKLIGIDKADAGRDVPSYFDLLPKSAAGQGSIDALRWWLTMQYEAVRHSDDKLAWQISGTGVRCQSENQFLTAEGEHLPTGKSEGTNRQFAERFTAGYAQLAASDTTFADARNVFDLALVAGLLTQQGLADQVRWNLGSFADGGLYQAISYPAPKEVDSVVNHRVYNGKDVVVQVAGGVNADPLSLLKHADVAPVSERLDGVAEQSRAPELPAGRWWWDAK